MTEYIVYKGLELKRPFMIVKELNNQRGYNFYNRDEIKALGEKYDEAARKSVIGMGSIEYVC